MAFVTVSDPQVTAFAGTPAANVLFSASVVGVKDQVKGSSATVFGIKVDNSSNTVASYLKLWNLLATSVTVGTTDPDEIVMIPPGSKLFVILNGVTGKVFGTALTVACVTTGGTGGTTPPGNRVQCEIALT